MSKRKGRSRSGRQVSGPATILESLERRQMLAASIPKIGDVLGYLAMDFATRPQAHQARSAYRNTPYALAKGQPNASLVRTINDTVLVKAVANAKGTAKLMTQLRALGASVTSHYGIMVTVAVPVSALAKVGGLTTLQYADASYAPLTNSGDIDDYGVQAMNADKGAKQFAADGTGVKVGILSDSYNVRGGASAGVASGDLPSGVAVLEESTSSSDTDEGRAMAEIVHDVAPGASIAFHAAFEGETDFAQGIVDLAAAGSKVIVDDVTYFDEPFFQDGIVAQAVNKANSVYGASYFSAAGNFARQSYESTFRPTATITIAGAGTGVFQDFDPGATTNVYQQITIPAGGSITLAFQWDAPFVSASANAGGAAAPTNSVGLYLLNSAKTGAVATATTSRVGGDAYQILTYTNSSATNAVRYLTMKVTAGNAPGIVKYIDYGGYDPTVQFATNSGTSVGHAVATGGRGVGAAPYYLTPAFNVTSPSLEDFSSSGGTPIFFAANGTPAATSYRNQPSLVGPDGGATTFFSDIDPAFDGQYHFFGTSAAAPHVAAVAALLLQAKPSLVPAEVYSTLESTALDMNTPGFDYDSGYGLVRADAAVAAVAAGSISGMAFRDLNNNTVFDSNDAAASGQTIYIDSNNNGVRDSGAGTMTNNTALAIPDATAANAAPSKAASSLITNFGGRVTSLTVSINASHPSNGDLGFTLITPSGVRIPLLTNLGYIGFAGTGINLTLSDSATNYVQDYASNGVLTGTFKPQTPLGAALNENATGTWQLEARDYRSDHSGTLNSWSINLTYADPSTTTDSNGVYTFGNLSPSAFYGNYNLRADALAGFDTVAPGAYALSLAAGSNTSARNFAFSNSVMPLTIASVIFDDGTAQRSMIRNVTLTFNGIVTTVGALAVLITGVNGTTGTYLAQPGAITSPSAGQTRLKFTLAGNGLTGTSLPDGQYQMTINGNSIADANGQKLGAAGNGTAGSTGIINFYRLYADIDGNRKVDFNDFLVLQNAFNSTSSSPNFVSGLDSNSDNVIDFNDFLALQNNFNKSI